MSAKAGSQAYGIRRSSVRGSYKKRFKIEMKERPTLETTRLTLRPFTVADASDVQRLAGEREIASTTLNIPHPYEEGRAEQWIATHQERHEKGEQVNFAIILRADQALIGAIGLQLASSLPARNSAIGRKTLLESWLLH